MPCIVKRTKPAKSVKKKKTFRTVLVRVWYLNIFKNLLIRTLIIRDRRL